ncbi:MAG: fused uroporphyrinogen-III synthase HemD/membrane protein HemX [Methylococcaceae bacterium]|nr:fused uroporphyrinogen-III synthase HemD/membrane protein HemX [Methylococcaceae bacterium]
MADLSGFGILVTRPAEQAEPLCRLIAETGAECIRLPLLEILPEGPESPGAAALATTGTADWLIFVSANAVRCGLALLDNDPTRLFGPRIAAIGQATADALARAGVTVDLTPKPQFNSESLLAMPELAEVAGKRVLIVRGRGGRELIAETLTARGADVAYAEVYRRVLPARDASAVLEAWRNGRIHAIVLTSGEALKNLGLLLAGRDKQLLTTTPAVVISDRIAEQAKAAGCDRVVTATGADDRAIVDALAGTLAELSRTSINHGDTPLADEEKELQPDAEQPAASPDIVNAEVPAAPPKKSHYGAWLGYLSLFFVVILAAGGFFLLQELRSKQEGLGGELNKGDQQMLELTRQITGLQSELATLHSQFATVQSQVTTEDSKFEREVTEQGSAFTDKLDSPRAELAAAIQHIQHQMNQSRGDLMIADAEYLLSVANQKLHLVGDVKAVLAMMEAADQRLHDSGDPAAFKVREALAEEIKIVKSISPPDLVGTSAKLLVMESEVRNLPLFLPHSDLKPDQHETTPSTGEGSDGFLDSKLKGFKDLVTVRRTDRPIATILAPEEASAIRQVMLLKLEMSRAALLRGDESMFQANIDSASQWLHENFAHDTAAVKEIAAELKTLGELKIQIPFPDISKSLTLLRNIEKVRLDVEKTQSGSKAAAPTQSPTPAAEPQPESGAQP